MTFNEDIMFGDMLDSNDQRKTKCYWTSQIEFPLEKIISADLVDPPGSRTSRFEGENRSNHSAQNSNVTAPKTPDISIPQVSKPPF